MRAKSRRAAGCSGCALLVVVAALVGGAGRAHGQASVAGPPAGARDAAAGGALDVRLVTIAPAHFHAALVQRIHMAGVSDTVHIYAEAGWDLAEHIKRIAGFNGRAHAPTHWTLEIHAAPDFLARMQRERAGNVAIISGRNQGKVERIAAALAAGMHVLCDKPWIIEPEEFPRLRELLAQAEEQHRIVYDIMTERYEVTNALQRELVASPSVFGTLERGTPSRPAILIEDVHHYVKTVAGRPNLRPVWYFDSSQQGEGIADTGTHLVDLVQDLVAPDRAIHPSEITVLSARRWPTRISGPQFERVTGVPAFPPELQTQVRSGALFPFANTHAVYTIAGVHVAMAAMWDWEARPGAGDWKYVAVRGTRARIEIRQGRRERYRPELYVIPVRGSDWAALAEALRSRVAELADRYPGLEVKPRGAELQVVIPEALRTSHEEHFSEVMLAFLGYLARPETLPPRERANLLAKYHTTVTITARSRENSVNRPMRRTAP